MTNLLPKKTYITTPIYYVNGQPHVGAALTTISCDVMARYYRLRGHETWFLTGTDENATKVQEAAEKAGVPTMEFVDSLASVFQECWRDLHIASDDFIRTTEPRHIRAVQNFFQLLLDNGCIYKDTYEGWYSVSDETFFRDSEVKDGLSIESGKPVERVQETNYFFRLSAMADRLKAHILDNPDFLAPDFRRNEVLAFIDEGLRDMSITRSRRSAKGWGIPVPGDEDQIIYVWFDAVINYLTATGWPDDPDWERLWPADLHFMGKEIFVRFHATLWPAMLLAAGLALPKRVYAHGWWTVRGIEGKAGKSTGGLPHPTRFTRFLAERSGTSFELAADAQRYLLCREMNYGQDVEFSVENCLRRFNTDLANDLGNLLNRTINMMVKYYEGVIPELTTEHDPEIVALAQQVTEDYARSMEANRLNIALESAWKLVARMNKYIDEKAPWALAKAANNGDSESAAQLASTLYSCLEATRIVSILAGPFMPVAANALRLQLGITKPVAEERWEDLQWGGLVSGSRVAPPQPLFPRIQELTVVPEILFALSGIEPTESEVSDESHAPKENTTTVSDAQTPDTTTSPPGTPVAPTAEAPTAAPLITIDDFMKVELRVGEVLAAEPVPNATKLLRLTVQVGDDDTRTILAGIAEYYQPEELIGRQVVVVANLQPRKMRGIESQGMLLAADVEGRAVLLQPRAEVPSGSRVR